MAAARNIHDSLHFLMEVFEAHGHGHGEGGGRTDAPQELQAPVDPGPERSNGAEGAAPLRKEGRP